ncbi:hypothetical protein GEMRC1_004550 [Eukaryota sp. GEM-RC1]
MENALDMSFKTAFFVTSNEDESVLKGLADRSNLRFKILRCGLNQLQNFRDSIPTNFPTASQEFQRSQAIYCYGIDVFDAPAEILCPLLDFSDLNRFAIGNSRILKLIDDDQFFGRRHKNFTRMFSRDEQISFSHSRYSAGISTISSSIAQKERLFKVADEQQQAQLDKLRAEESSVHDELETLREEKRLLLQKRRELFTETQDDMSQLNEKRREIINLIKLHQTIPTQISAIQRFLSSLTEAPVKDLERVEEELRPLDQLVEQKTLEVNELIEQHTLLRVKMEQINEKILELDAKNRSVAEELRTLDHHIHSLTAEIENTKKAIQRCKQSFRHAHTSFQEHHQAFCDSYPDEPIEQLLGELTDDLVEVEASIQRADAHLRAIADVSPSQIREYQKKSAVLKDLEREIEGEQAQLQAQYVAFTEKRALFQSLIEPFYEELSRTFSHHFTQLGINGTITLEIPETTFASNAKLSIKCSFRAGAPLAELNNARQSGR